MRMSVCDQLDGDKVRRVILSDRIRIRSHEHLDDAAWVSSDFGPIYANNEPRNLPYLHSHGLFFSFSLSTLATLYVISMGVSGQSPIVYVR